MSDPAVWLTAQNFKMKRHALLEIMVEAPGRIQQKRWCYAGSAQYGWNLLCYVYLDKIIEIQTSCATKPRLRAGAASLYVLGSPEANGFRQRA